MNEFPLYRGEHVEKLIEENPLFDTTIFYKTENISRESDGLFVKACMSVNVDPEIVVKQACLIQKLQKALDSALNEKFFLEAPSFKKYVELEKENRTLKAALNTIRSFAEERL